jgi:hypothetical protein
MVETIKIPKAASWLKRLLFLLCRENFVFEPM